MSKVAEHFNQIANHYDYFKEKNWYYYSNLKKLYSGLIPINSNILEIGCGTGDILAHLKPSYGLGIDISGGMIKLAKKKHKEWHKIEFLTGTIEGLTDLVKHKKFDYVFLSDVVEHLEDPPSTFQAINRAITGNATVIISMTNPLWEPLLLVLEKLKLKMPEGPHQRISIKKLELILKQNNLKIIKKGYRLILPAYIPFLSNFLNRYFYRIPILKNIGLVIFWVCVKRS